MGQLHKGVQMRVCTFCASPYRDEIVTLWKQGVGRRIVYEKYAPLMKYTAKFRSFGNLMYHHLQHKTNNNLILTTADKRKIHTIDTIADRFTELLGERAKTMKPEDVTVKDYSAAQKVAIENRKLKLTEDMMEIQLSKIFGPPLVGEIQEGEVVHGLGPGKDNTDKPVDPQ